MAIKIYNTLTKDIEEFIPLEEGKVKMYACGITVYDEAHIGHAAQAVFFDVIRRYLEYKDLAVEYVRNFTDIDDKIINRANETGRTASEISEQYIAETQDDLIALKVNPATFEPKVTEHMPEIIRFIQQLCDKEMAYESDGNVFFRVNKFSSYGKLSNCKVDEMKSQEQVEGKENPADFTLWKKSKANEPLWESPWGDGRPGWHIECSALARHFLGDTIDIHGGGIDLVFPHHENEIAQSEAVTGKTMAKYWIHNGLVMVDNKKMSKSLGNFYTIKQALKLYVPDVIRYIILTHNYSSNIDFSLEAFRVAEQRIFYFYKTLAAIDVFLEEAPPAFDSESANGSLGCAFEESMDDNFNTAKLIGEISTAFSNVNTLLGKKNTEIFKRAPKICEFLADLDRITKVLGILDQDPIEMMEEIKSRFISRTGISETQIEEKILKRIEAKSNKDYSTADEIRKELEDMGIKILDYSDKSEWEIQGE